MGLGLGWGLGYTSVVGGQWSVVRVRDRVGARARARVRVRPRA